MGADSGFLRLITVPEVKTCADLRGKQVSVDAMTTGYAFVLRKLLEEGELKSSDIQFVSAGDAAVPGSDGKEACGHPADPVL